MNRSIRHTFLTATVACGLWLAPVTAQTTATTDPVGAMTVTINGGSPGFTAFSAPLLQTANFTGKVESVGSSSLSFAGAPFSPSEFSGVDPTGSATYYVEILEGVGEGQMLDIQSNDSSSVSIITGGVSLDTLVSVGDEVRIAKHSTIADLFGESNEFGLRSGANVANSDSVYLMNPDGSGVYSRYYYQTDPLGGAFGGTGWRLAGNTSKNMADVRVDSDQGLVIVRDEPTAIEVTFSGVVKMTSASIPLPSGFSLKSDGFPMETTLGSSGLYKQDGSGLSGGANAANAGNIYIMQADGSFDRYYYQIDPLSGAFGGDGWRKAGDSFSDQSGTIIPSGSAVILSLDSPGAWNKPVPY